MVDVLILRVEQLTEERAEATEIVAVRYGSYFTSTDKMMQLEGKLSLDTFFAEIKIVAKENKVAKETAELTTRSIEALPLSSLPDNVQTSYKFLSDKNWQTGVAVGEGVPAGKIHDNINNLLPEKSHGYYREFAVNPKNSQGIIDGQRFVIGQNMEVFYTADHYASFVSIK